MRQSAGADERERESTGTDADDIAEPMARGRAPSRSPPDFFFSSRRRHTRWNCDWSSDVCSSDLDLFDTAYPDQSQRMLILDLVQTLWDRSDPDGYASHMRGGLPNTPTHEVLLRSERASCRERGEDAGVAVVVKEPVTDVRVVLHV